MRKYIFTDLERQILRRHFGGAKLVRSDQLGLSKLKLRTRNSVKALTEDFELLEKLLAETT
jgi:hypothetical protein